MRNTSLHAQAVRFWRCKTIFWLTRFLKWLRTKRHQVSIIMKWNSDLTFYKHIGHIARQTGFIKEALFNLRLKLFQVLRCWHIWRPVCFSVIVAIFANIRGQLCFSIFLRVVAFSLYALPWGMGKIWIVFCDLWRRCTCGVLINLGDLCRQYWARQKSRRPGHVTCSLTVLCLFPKNKV